MKLVSLTICIAVAASAANVSGKWTVQNAGRGGQMSLTVIQLNQVGNVVTGTVTPPRIDSGTSSPVNIELFDGKVDGDTVSFYVWIGTDEPVKVFYKGTMSGDEIKFTVTGAPPPAARGGSREMVAKRAH